MNPNKKDQMHPDDVRNLIIFAIASIAIWFMYETFILAPQAKAIKEARRVHAEKLLNDPSLFKEEIENKNDLSVKQVKKVDRSKILSSGIRISIDNEEITGSLSLVGARIDDISLNKYFKTFKKKEKVSILNPSGSERTRFIDFGWVSSDKEIMFPNSSTLWQVKGNKHLTPDSPVTLVWDNGQGIYFERILSIDNQYMFNIVQKIINKSGKDIYANPYGLVSQIGIPQDPEARKRKISYEGPLGFINGKLEHMPYKEMVKTTSKKIEAQRGWIGFSDKYWLTALIPLQNNLTKYRFKCVPNTINEDNNKYQIDFTSAEKIIKNNEEAQYSQHFYVGVKKILTLEDYQKKLKIDKLDLAVDFGWFWFFTYPFFLLLHYLGLFTGNMGFAIIIQTIILRMAVFPLTNFSYRSFAKMKKVNPIVSELRDKYKDDKETLQAEIVKLYQKEGVNPMSGCLPIIIQIPIFFAFYKILFTTIEIRHAPFIGWIQDLSGPDPTSIFNLFGLLDYDVSSLPHIGVWPCLMLIATLVQRQLNPPPQDKTQRFMMNIFPFFITYIMARFPAGLVIYWTFSATISVLQQMFIMRSLGVPIYIFNKDKATQELEAKIDKGPDVHPLLEMAEEEVEQALFGDEDSNVSDAPTSIKPPKPKKKTQNKSKKKKK